MKDNEIIKTFAEATKDALDLIERQQSEIERLKLQLAVKDKKIECLCGIVVAIKEQSIKEFAERLKLEAYTECDITGYRYQVVQVEEIDNLVKEMIGKENKNEKD